VVREILRRDLTSFILRSFQTVAPGIAYRHNWHIELIADRLVAVFGGRITRLIITVPPRSLKSLCASVAFPAWVLGHDPAHRIICASYGVDLALKHARDCRHILDSHWYHEVFPRTRLNRKKTAEDEFETTGGGYRISTSLGGTLTGRGGNVLIVDDPIKPQDALSPARRKSVTEWFEGTLYSRLDDKRRDAIIVIMQRVHVDDLVGHLLAKGGWRHINLAAIATSPERFALADGRVFTRSVGDALHPDREPLAVLDDIRATVGSYHFEAQYQQAPAPEQGNLVKWSWFRRYAEIPFAEPGDRIVQSWDTAMTAHDGSDWSACVTAALRGNDIYVIDVFRERLDFPSLKARIYALKQEFAAHDVVIEDKGSGTGLIQQLKSEGQLRPIGFAPEGSKADRMAAQSAGIEAGYVLLPEQAPWLEVFRGEMLAFPHGKHDDQVDAFSQLLGWIERGTRNRTSSVEFLL